jgi:hypothetical protein
MLKLEEEALYLCLIIPALAFYGMWASRNRRFGVILGFLLPTQFYFCSALFLNCFLFTFSPSLSTPVNIGLELFCFVGLAVMIGWGWRRVASKLPPAAVKPHETSNVEWRRRSELVFVVGIIPLIFEFFLINLCIEIPIKNSIAEKRPLYYYGSNRKFKHYSAYSLPASAQVQAASDDHRGIQHEGFYHIIFDASPEDIKSLLEQRTWQKCEWSSGPVNDASRTKHRLGRLRGGDDFPVPWSSQAIQFISQNRGHDSLPWHRGRIFVVNRKSGRVWFTDWNY